MIIELDKKDNDLLTHPYLVKKNIPQEIVNNPFARILLYYENNEIIGYLYFSDIYDRVEINQIEIEEIHRNCGKGDHLLKEMIHLVHKNITLEVRKDNNPAIHLYEKNHFKQVAIRKNYYNGMDGILMERKI